MRKILTFIFACCAGILCAQTDTEFDCGTQEKPFDITLRPDTTIMPGDSALMWAQGADFYRWEPENTIIKTSDNLIYAKPAVTTSYTVTGYKMSSDKDANLVYNGDFDLGNVGFITDLRYFSPYTATSGSGKGKFTISDDVQALWKNAASHKAYGGSGNMMIIDGTTTPNSILWQQDINVTPDTYYAFSAQVMSCLDSYSQGQYALLQFSINNTQLGPILHSPDVLYQWSINYGIWYSGSNTTARLCILNQNNNGNGNDFAIDEIRLEELGNGACEVSKTVTVYVEKRYTVTFVNYDGTVLQSSLEDFGTMPEYKGDTPVRPDDGEDTFTFIGWSPELTSVTGDATYTALYHNNSDKMGVTVTIPDVCADDNTLDIQMTFAEEIPIAYSVAFDAKAVAQGFLPKYEGTFSTSSTADITIPLPKDAADSTHYVRPDCYTLEITLTYKYGINYTVIQAFAVRYPSWLILQRWNDLFTLRNVDYNGGYTFSSVRWFHEGTPIEGRGEQGTYVYVSPSLAYGEAYWAELTRADDGVTMTTCPFYPAPMTDKTEGGEFIEPFVTVTPTVLSKDNMTVTVETNICGTYFLYHTDGNLLYRKPFCPPADNGVFTIDLSTYITDAGVYALVFHGVEGTKTTTKIIVKP